MKIIISLLLLSLSPLAFAEQVVNIYNWSDYIPDKVIALFEKQTGIKVNYATFENNQALYAKLKSAPDSGYDIVFPSTYFVERMAKEHMLQHLNLSKITYFKDLNPHLMNLSYDPHNQYSLPYLWGSTSIIVNDKYYNPKSITQWQDLWEPRFKGQLLLLDDMRDVFSIALRKLGYSINDRNPKHIYQAFVQLKKLLPNVKLFNEDGALPIYLDGDAVVGILESGDGYVLNNTDPHLHFVYPKNQVVLSMDCIAIPINAPHLKNAYRFINFLMRPEVSKMISVGLGYSTPNKAAVKLMSKTEQQNPILNPPESVLKDAQMEADVGNKTNAIYMHYWEMLKLSA